MICWAVYAARSFEVLSGRAKIAVSVELKIITGGAWWARSFDTCTHGTEIASSTSCAIR